MLTLKDLINRCEREIAAKLAQRAANVTELAQIRGKDEATDADAARVEELRGANKQIDTELDALEVKVAEYRAEDAADTAAAERGNEMTDAAASPDEKRGPAVVTSEERTYAPHKERSFDKRAGKFRPGTGGAGSDFARDVAAAYLGDFGARARLERHMQEEQVERGADFLERAAGTGAFAGLTVPQYLTDLYAPAVAASRPFADVCRKLPLPEKGMTVNISRITTATSTAVQSSENSAVSETNIDDTLLTESVQTAGGQQTLSRQAIDRSTGAESVVMDDLFRRYGTTVDSTLITQATTGLSAVANAVAYTDASPTAAELYPKVLNAQANLESVYLDQQVQRPVAVLHSRRWHWLASQVGTSWPFMSQPGIATQAGAVNYAEVYGGGFRGLLPNGTPVVVDNNIATNLGAGTNEDEIYIVNADECFLWEDPSAPMFIRAEQPAAASLGVLLVVYGYFAYSFRRYTNGQAKVGGTGLVTPTF